ncbi:Isochorismatase hydrolase [Suillus paluster]|uniref:Isochorismatase hydrolase n=1 Tax=Suillus paluster TaxID=48578 RepID=UPI001B86624E|nr:Isochorismatase hydrolase [Suillus paluster]KAG1749961.1 Isochorismatase hydrolase [Suillus paluster]
MSQVPIHDTPILGMAARPKVSKAVEYGNPANFWVEYPSGLMDLTRSQHLMADAVEPSLVGSAQLDIPVNGDRTIRVDKSKTAAVIIDMQNFFLHPELRIHKTGLECVDPLLKLITPLRKQGVKILWVNWGLTDPELQTIPPSLARGFRKGGFGGFGTEMPGNFGRLLMRDARNSELYGPLQGEYLKGQQEGTDVWIHKNRMSGLWGHQSALDLYLKENGITTLLFGGVNADQCVGGTLVDAYFQGYDCVLVEDITATTSPAGGLENVIYNAGNSQGFVTNTSNIISASG